VPIKRGAVEESAKGTEAGPETKKRKTGKSQEQLVGTRESKLPYSGRGS